MHCDVDFSREPKKNTHTADKLCAKFSCDSMFCVFSAIVCDGFLFLYSCSFQTIFRSLPFHLFALDMNSNKYPVHLFHPFLFHNLFLWSTFNEQHESVYLIHLFTLLLFYARKIIWITLGIWWESKINRLIKQWHIFCVCFGMFLFVSKKKTIRRNAKKMKHM